MVIIPMKERKTPASRKNSPPNSPETKKANLGLGPEDKVWTGDDGNLNPETLLWEHGWHPETPLAAILLAIIDAHPLSEGSSRIKRLEIAMEALTGVKRKRGADKIDDYDLLSVVARRYWAEWRAGNPNPAPDIIARSAFNELPPNDPRRRRASTLEAQVKRIADEFRSKRDLLLARVTLEDDWNSRDTARAVTRAVEALRALGIPVAEPQLRRTEP
ncbi:hypothetical protein [Microvirga terrestris]|uniref:DUF1376 domain-containing protein n=1 Tax=Microvirga terrestris TaxID=2791024 RepID=A0ABS0HRI9_9HYPH|nr:hypothetical protein [Microvirga terrestris]MBF9196102.1 hypothetical protein [Microvirga terrestris]